MIVTWLVVRVEVDEDSDDFQGDEFDLAREEIAEGVERIKLGKHVRSRLEPSNDRRVTGPMLRAAFGDGN